MKKSLYDKLLKNPHHKISGRQRQKMEEEEREEMVEFGDPQIHNHEVPIHQVQRSPKKRKSPKMLE